MYITGSAGRCQIRTRTSAPVGNGLPVHQAEDLERHGSLDPLGERQRPSQTHVHVVLPARYAGCLRIRMARGSTILRRSAKSCNRFHHTAVYRTRPSPRQFHTRAAQRVSRRRLPAISGQAPRLFRIGRHAIARLNVHQRGWPVAPARIHRAGTRDFCARMQTWPRQPGANRF